MIFKKSNQLFILKLKVIIILLVYQIEFNIFQIELDINQYIILFIIYFSKVENINE
jgi:hypothetical protein